MAHQRTRSFRIASLALTHSWLVTVTVIAVEPTPLNVEDCFALEEQYVAALQEARACHPLAQVNQCDVSVDDSLICACPTYVNHFNVPALGIMARAKSAFDAAGCIGYWDCTAGLCPGVYGSSCLDADPASKPGNNRGRCRDWSPW